ncbi:MAG: DUF4097 family beta strand repeat-containing protein [Spirosomataceae bacterium]
MKRNMLLSALLVGCFGAAFAQEFKAKLANAKDRKITIEMDAGDLKIEGYDGDEVLIKGNGFQAPPEQAKGLKALYNTAVDNTGIGLAVTSQANGLKIEKASRKQVTYTLRVPKKAAVFYEQANWNRANISINNVEGDLEIKTNNGKIELLNVTGPVVANSTAGDIKVVYSQLNQEKPSAISVISGTIDVTMPANAKANLSLRSINGEMYTDFDLGMKSSKDGLARVGGGHNIEATANGGGVEVQLKSISSNIYLRKQNL